MKFNIPAKFLAGIAVLAALASCAKKEILPEPFVINSSISGMSSTEQLADGLEVGLFVGYPLNKSNVKLVVKDGKLECSEKLEWLVSQTDTTTFTAYAPYDASLTVIGKTSVKIAADQSQEATLNGTHILYSKVVVPPCKPIDFSFTDHTAQVEANFKLPEGETLKSVVFSGLHTAVSLNVVNGTATANGEAADIKPFKASENNGTFKYCARAFAGETPTVTVTLASGREVLVPTGSSVYEIPSFDITVLTEPGIYDSKGNVAMAAEEFEQTSYGHSEARRYWRTMNIWDKTEVQVMLYAKNVTESGTVSALVTAVGRTIPTAGSGNLIVEKATSEMLWLHDTSRGYYYIMPID